MEDCVFCKIIRGELPADVVYENEDVIVFYGLHSMAPVHVLVVPKKHIRNVNDFEASDAVLLWKLHEAMQIVANKLGVEKTGYRIITNTEADATQDVFHIHYHLVGGRKLEWSM
ncbi:MAG: histidine triad nucleotide-binding protein [Bacilli bacterium]